MRLTDEDLVAAIHAEERVALDSQDSELAKERSDALARYRGEASGPLAPVEGRSSVVSRDLMDTIQWIVPSLARMYLGGDEIGKFEPVGQEDEERAQIETEVVNWMIREKNDAFSHVVAGLTDGLLLKVGYIMGYWANNQDIRTETYEGLTDDEVAILLQDPEVEAVEHTEVVDPLMGMLHSVKVERKYTDEYVGIECIPPDEILVSRRHRWTSLEKADFVQWRRRVTIGQLRAEGFKVPDDVQEYTEDVSEERENRERFSTTYAPEDETGDVTRRTVMCKDTYIRMDLRDEGVPQLWRVVIIDGMSKPIYKQEAECIPVAAFSPIIYPHSHLGTSISDLVSDLSVIKSVMMRQLVDGVFLQNSGRVGVNVNSLVNMDDLLVSRPGGVVRVEGDPSAALFPIPQPDAGPTILTALEYMEAVKEGRTGVTRYSAGLDANTLNKTATGVQAIQSAANQRIELIARTLASGFRDLFMVVHTLLSKHSTKPLQIKLRGQWTQVDPRSWAKRTDFSISVGLGTGSPEVQMQKLMLIGQVMQQGQALGIVGPEEFLNWFDDLCKAAGYKNPRRFAQEVKKDEQGNPVTPPPPKPEIVQAKEVEGQIRMQELQMQTQAKGAEIQHQAAIDRERMQNELTLQASNDARELEITKYKIDREMELERFKAELTVQKDLEVARIKAAATSYAADQSADAHKTVAKGTEDAGGEKLAGQLAPMLKRLEEVLSSPRKIVRGPDGRAQGVDIGGVVRMIERDKDGRAAGLH